MKHLQSFLEEGLLGACAKKQLALSGLLQSILSRATKANGGVHYMGLLSIEPVAVKTMRYLFVYIEGMFKTTCFQYMEPGGFETV